MAAGSTARTRHHPETMAVASELESRWQNRRAKMAKDRPAYSRRISLIADFSSALRYRFESPAPAFSTSSAMA